MKKKAVVLNMYEFFKLFPDSRTVIKYFEKIRCHTMDKRFERSSLHQAKNQYVKEVLTANEIEKKTNLTNLWACLLMILFLCAACESEGGNWHCVTKKERGRMLRWGGDFIQYGQRLFFAKHVKPGEYFWKAPDFSKSNKGIYQDPLEWEKPIPKDKYRYRFPYNIKITKQFVRLRFLISGQFYVLYETPTGEIWTANQNVYEKIESGELDFVTEYYSNQVIVIQDIHFDISTKTLTDTYNYKLSPHINWGRRQIKKDSNNQIHHSPDIGLTSEEKEQLYDTIQKALGGFPKTINKTSNCREDNFIVHYFRQMGNSWFNVLRH